MMGSAQTAKRRVAYAISIDRATVSRNRLGAYSGGTRLIFDSVVTVLADETVDLIYDPSCGEFSAFICTTLDTRNKGA